MEAGYRPIVGHTGAIPVVVGRREDGSVARRRAVLTGVAMLSAALFVTLLAGNTHRQVSLAEESIEVTAEDIERLGLSAPAGFNVPGVNVTDADKERYGLNGISADSSRGAVNVTVEDKARYGFNPVQVAAGDGTSAVTDEDKERLGLIPLSVDNLDAGVAITPDDVDRYGLVAPSGSRARAEVNVTDDDVEKYGLTVHKVLKEEIDRLGLSEPLNVTDADVANLGVKWPVGVTDEEAAKMGLKKIEVSEDDMDTLGLRDPTGWNATGFSPHAK